VEFFLKQVYNPGRKDQVHGFRIGTVEEVDSLTSLALVAENYGLHSYIGVCNLFTVEPNSSADNKLVLQTGSLHCIHKVSMAIIQSNSIRFNVLQAEKGTITALARVV